MVATMQVRSIQQARFLGTPLVSHVKAVVPRARTAGRAECSAMEPKEVAKVSAMGAVAASFLSAGHVQAAQEISQIADSDNRFGAILLLLGPAIGWVLFNISGPAFRQLDNMSDAKPKAKPAAPRKAPARKPTKRRGVAAAVGLGAAASLALADQADAATQFAQLAESDNRLGALLLLVLPALGWVLFNIGGPASRQLDSMSKKSVVAGLGLGAAGLFLADNADAATQFAQLADSDNRLGALLLLVLPALGWVLFNIGGPASRQLDSMSKK